MTLLDLLRELEPDAGWHDDGVLVVGVVAARSRANEICAMTRSPDDDEVIVSIYTFTAIRGIEAHAPDLRAALKMALAGYRAGETR